MAGKGDGELYTLLYATTVWLIFTRTTEERTSSPGPGGRWSLLPLAPRLGLRDQILEVAMAYALMFEGTSGAAEKV